MFILGAPRSFYCLGQAQLQDQEIHANLRFPFVKLEYAHSDSDAVFHKNGISCLFRHNHHCYEIDAPLRNAPHRARMIKTSLILMLIDAHSAYDTIFSCHIMPLLLHPLYLSPIEEHIFSSMLLLRQYYHHYVILSYALSAHLVLATLVNHP